jgi:hypothetical protein
MAGSCEHIEPSGSIKFWEFLEWLSNAGFIIRAQLYGIGYS